MATRHPQVVRAIGTIGHRHATAEQCRDLVHRAERPVAVAVVKLEDRAGLHLEVWHGAIAAQPSKGPCRSIAFRPGLHRRHDVALDHVGRQCAFLAQPVHLAGHRRARAIQAAGDLRRRVEGRARDTLLRIRENEFLLHMTSEDGVGQERLVWLDCRSALLWISQKAEEYGIDWG